MAPAFRIPPETASSIMEAVKKEKAGEADEEEEPSIYEVIDELLGGLPLHTLKWSVTGAVVLAVAISIFFIRKSYGTVYMWLYVGYDVLALTLTVLVHWVCGMVEAENATPKKEG